jgi:hypothetical protein
MRWCAAARRLQARLRDGALRFHGVVLALRHRPSPGGVRVSYGRRRLPGLGDKSSGGIVKVC